MENFPSAKKQTIERADISREERIEKIKNFFNAAKKYAEFSAKVVVLASGVTLSGQEVLAGGETGYKNVAEKNGLVEKMEESSFLEKDLTEKFIQEINKIDETLPENEIEQAIQTEISRMELLLSSQNIVQGKGVSKTSILGERAKNVLEKKQILEKNSFKPAIKKVLEEMLSTSLIID